MTDITQDINTLGTAVYGRDMRTALVNISTELNDRTAGGGAYTLPVATSTTLGGIKVGAGLQTTGAGVLSTTKDLDDLDSRVTYASTWADAAWRWLQATRSQITATIASLAIPANSSRSQTFTVTQAGVYQVNIQRYINNSLTSGRLTMRIDNGVGVTENYQNFVGGGCISFSGLVYLTAGSHTITYQSTFNASCTLTADAAFNFINGYCAIPDVGAVG